MPILNNSTSSKQRNECVADEAESEMIMAMIWSDKRIKDAIWAVDNRRIESNGLDSEVAPIMRAMRDEYEARIMELEAKYAERTGELEDQKLDQAWTQIEALEKMVSAYHARTGHDRAHDACVALTDAMDALQDLVEVEERKCLEVE